MLTRTPFRSLLRATGERVDRRAGVTKSLTSMRRTQSLFLLQRIQNKPIRSEETTRPRHPLLWTHHHHLSLKKTRVRVTAKASRSQRSKSSPSQNRRSRVAPPPPSPSWRLAPRPAQDRNSSAAPGGRARARPRGSACRPPAPRPGGWGAAAQRQPRGWLLLCIELAPNTRLLLYVKNHSNLNSDFISSLARYAQVSAQVRKYGAYVRR